jgi:hypothetical protein
LSAGARSLEIKLIQPGGATQVLLWVKQFRADWQMPYAFRTPIALRPGATLRAYATFDPEHAGGELKVVMNAYPDSSGQ